MQTTLPNLPFPCKGIFSDPNDSRSSPNSKPRAFPRTDFRALGDWTSFNLDIDYAICSAMQQNGLHQNVQITVGLPFPETTQVWCEEEVRIHASGELHRAVKDVLGLLGIKGVLRAPSGNHNLIGAPDFSWLSTGDDHPKLVAEYTTDWVATLQNLRSTFSKNRLFRTRDERQSFEALEQIYGYMTFNNLRYGILTNWTNTWAIRRVETANRKTLQCAGPFSVSSQPSILKVFVGMVLLAEKDWFYASPTSNIPPPSCFFSLAPSGQQGQMRAIHQASTYQAKPTRNKTYDLLPLDFRLCDFILSSARPTEAGCIVQTELRQESLLRLPLSVTCKTVDALRYPAHSAMLQAEANNYAALHHLQCVVIPRVRGLYTVWGILHVLALEPVGDPIKSSQLNPALRQQMKVALARIHSAGYLHGDISLDNFCRRDDGRVFIVDLEECQQSTVKSEMDEEQALIDLLV